MSIEHFPAFLEGTSAKSTNDTTRQRDLGAVYTPRVLADWVAGLVARIVPSGNKLRIIDPACGDGMLLRAAREAFSGTPVELTGVDIDPLALYRCGLADAQLIQRDALVSFRPKKVFDALIANPPWGASLALDAKSYRDRGFSLALGQFDSYDLFLELGLQLVKPGGVLAWIIPDSIFALEHTRTRELLTERCTIEMIARLGEGFFPGVFRGTTVLLMKNAPAPAHHRIQCLRIGREQREAVLSGTGRFSQYERLAVYADQHKFRVSAGCRWDIDVSEDDEAPLLKIEAMGSAWTKGLLSGRGVELSKNGAILTCRVCGHTVPLPKGSTDSCRACGNGSSLHVRSIVSTASASAHSVPLIVGEDVNRHRCQPSRFIELGLAGLNYKSVDQFKANKLLVRKTGIGLKAAVDRSGSYTNQVVFSYRLEDKAGRQDWYLDYLEGVLCSRVLFAYHLKKNGETEWRSHPYVTQASLAKLPIPDADSPAIRPLAKRVAQLIEEHRYRASFDSDLAIENLVATLFGLKDQECEWVMGVIESAQHLEPVRSLRLPRGAKIQPVHSGAVGVV